MLKLFLKILAGVTLLFCAQANAQSTLPRFSVTYTLENNYITAGNAEFTLQGNESQGYQLVLQTNPTGMFRFSKNAKIREVAELPSLAPPFLSDKYTYTNLGNKKRSYMSVYDREKATATTVRSNSSESIKIDVDAVDRLSMSLAVMNKLHEEPDIQKFSIKMLDRNGTEIINFVAKGQETIKTDIGKLRTTRIDRQRINSNRNTVTWLATIGPGNLPIPVQIEQYKNDKLTVRLKVTAFKISE